jgi:RNA polymerase sigma-70 factor, ECF subfamily
MFGFSDIKTGTDEQLMVLIARGRKKAFAELYDRYYGRLVNFAYSHTADIPQAEDIVQDIFIKIMEHPEMFDTTRRFKTWVYTVTINACRNVQRNEANRRRLLQQDILRMDAAAAPEILRSDKRLLALRVSELLEQLSEKEKMVYVLRFAEGLTIPEISKTAGIPEGSVKSCIHYLLKKFAEHLKDFKND